MTTLGLHYFPDEVHYRQTDLQAWLPELVALDVNWLTLLGSLTKAVPEHFVKALLDAGIEPIIHLPAIPTKQDRESLITGEGFGLLFRTYARWGVKYVVPFSEPNSRAAWAPADWGQAGLVERFLDLLVPVLEAETEAGLSPVFPALKAGGDYWDTAFLEASLAALVRREKADLMRKLMFAVNLWTFNRPVTWGEGGLQGWPETRPYLTPPGSQDQRGFCLFDWYDEIIQDRVGESRPFLCLAGGPSLYDKTDPQFPPVTEEWHASCIQQIADAANAGTLPENLLNVNFWLLAAQDGSPYGADAWYQNTGKTLLAVSTLKRMANPAQRAERRRMREAEARAKLAGSQVRPLKHYVLMPTFEWGVSEWHWNAALDFVKTHRPACGFSADEARQAQHVTIIGNEQGVTAEVEAGLRRAGCSVERLRLASDH